MQLLSDNPKLGHITTFGGNPVIASAALETLLVLENTELIKETLEKERLIRQLLKHDLITEIRGRGLMLSLIMKSPELADALVLKAKEQNLILFWLLFEKRAVRITPPLTITNDELTMGCELILQILNELQ